MLSASNYNGLMSQASDQPALRWYLREWRKAKKLKQHQVAEAIGTAISVISDLEAGKKRMNDDWILGWARALGLSPADLLRHPDEQNLAASSEGRLLAKLYFSLPPVARDEAVNYLEFQAAKTKSASSPPSSAPDQAGSKDRKI